MATSIPVRPFTGVHVALVGKLSVLSLREARAIVARLGGTLADELTPDTTMVLAGTGIDRTSELPSHVSRLISESDLCREAGLPDVETLRTQYRSAREIRGMYPGLREETLRHLEKCGLLRPVAGRYSFADLHVIRQAAAEIERGATMRGLLRVLGAQQGQLALDFQGPHADRTPARVVALPARAPVSPALFPLSGSSEAVAATHAMAARYFLEGAELDDGETRDLERAAAAYRRAAMFDPQLVPALVNLANVHYERDALVEAEALYEKAIRTDGECFEAYFNLGNIHHDLGRYAEAVAAYRDALAINPGYPEAHFYLAVTLEKLGRSLEARPHWREYRSLAPDGEFVDLAKEFSE